MGIDGWNLPELRGGEDVNLRHLSARIMGEAGSKVTLDVRKGRAGKVFSITLTRAQVNQSILGLALTWFRCFEMRPNVCSCRCAVSLTPLRARLAPCLPAQVESTLEERPDLGAWGAHQEGDDEEIEWGEQVDIHDSDWEKVKMPDFLDKEDEEAMLARGWQRAEDEDEEEEAKEKEQLPGDAGASHKFGGAEGLRGGSGQELQFPVQNLLHGKPPAVPESVRKQGVERTMSPVKKEEDVRRDGLLTAAVQGHVARIERLVKEAVRCTASFLTHAQKITSAHAKSMPYVAWARKNW